MIFLKAIPLFLLVSVLSVGGNPSFAQLVERISLDRQLAARPASTNDEVGVAFLKMSNNSPDFNKIIGMSDDYKKLDPLAQKDFQAKKADQIQNAYLAFTPQKSDLIIRMKANVLFQKLANGESTLKLRTFKEDLIYFPFYFGGYPIALIIKDMDIFKNITLTKEETDIVYSRLSLSGDMTLLVQVYPIAANDKKPMLLDNIKQYPMLSEIGYIGMLNDQSDQIWAWRNTKYGKKSVSSGDTRPIVDLIPDSKK